MLECYNYCRCLATDRMVYIYVLWAATETLGHVLYINRCL